MLNQPNLARNTPVLLGTNEPDKNLTDVALRVGDGETKSGEEEDEDEVEEEVGKVDPGSKLAPLVVEEAGHQRVAQELATIVVHLHTVSTKLFNFAK